MVIRCWALPPNSLSAAGSELFRSKFAIPGWMPLGGEFGMGSRKGFFHLSWPLAVPDYRLSFLRTGGGSSALGGSPSQTSQNADSCSKSGFQFFTNNTFD